MNEEDYLKIYEKCKNNSVGEDKKIKKNKTTITTNLKKTVATFIAILSMSSLIGCGINKNNSSIEPSTMYWTIDETWNGYTYDQISKYEKSRIYNKIGIDNVQNIDMYTTNDFINIGFNESYLLGFYLYFDENIVTEFCKSIGYENLNDYLIKNNYMDKDNNPVVDMWVADALENSSELMLSREVGKTR